MLLEGIFLPLLTPFRADEHVYLHKLKANVEHYSRTPAAGMVVLSHLGEPESLTDGEVAEVLTCAIHAAAESKVMIASVGRESVYRTLLLADLAFEFGYDAVAVRGTSFSDREAFTKETLNYFAVVADRSRLPVVLVDEPARRLSAEMLAKLADHPNVIGAVTTATADEIVGIKAATASVKRTITVTPVFAAATNRMLRAKAAAGASLGGVAVLDVRPAVATRTKQVSFQVLAGSTTGMLRAWQSGASGSVPGLAACAPQACCEVWQAFRDKDTALAEEKQERLRSASGYLESDGNMSVAALKYGCDFNAYYGGWPRLPLLPLKEEDRARVERELAGMRN